MQVQQAVTNALALVEGLDCINKEVLSVVNDIATMTGREAKIRTLDDAKRFLSTLLEER